MKSNIKFQIANDPDRKSWPGRLLRTGFHDCFPESCDGSIRFETDRPENIRIERVLHFLNNTREGTCVSLADTIKLGLEVAMELTGAPRLRCPLGTKDATKPNPFGTMPFPNHSFDTIMSLFRSKGFTYEEGLAGNFGGHSIGGFRDEHSRKLFTPTENRYGNDYANILAHDFFGTPGYNALPSDLHLSFWDMRGVVQGFADDKSKLDKAFSRFMTKLCRM